MYRIFLSLTLLIGSSSLSAKPYKTVVDDFTGQHTHKSKAIASKGGGKFTSVMLSTDSSKLEVWKIVFGSDVDIESFRDEAASIGIEDISKGVFVLAATVIGHSRNYIEGEDSLIIRIDGEFFEFDAQFIDSEIIATGSTSSRAYKSLSTLGFYVPLSILKNVLTAKDVVFRVEGTKTNATMELKSKGRKRLKQFLKDVP